MLDALINALRAPDIRRRILFVLVLLVVFRFLAHIPVPGVNQNALANVLQGNDFLQLLNLFSGGGFSNFSLVALGVNPYINASIIMQLMQGVVPRLQALSREGEYGRTKLNQYTRYLAVPMALIQAYGYLAILSNNTISGGTPVISSFNLASLLTITQIITLTAGTIFTMWLGELITERGIGNGISFIIFAGIVSRIPQGIEAFLASPDFALGTVFVIFAIFAVFAVVYMQEGQRRIPVQYASRVRGRRMYQGGSTFLPLRVNQAGVIPIIFAISILLLPEPAGDLLLQLLQRRRQGLLAGPPELARPAQLAVRRPVLPADGGLHLLLHGLHLQAGRDGRPAAQERRLHPRHPPGQPHARLPGARRRPHQPRRGPLPGRHRRAADAHLQPRLGLGPRPTWASAAPPC